MKKLTKKILSLALAMLMAASLASVAFAAGGIQLTAQEATAAAVDNTNHIITAYYSESGCYVTLTATVDAGYTDTYLNWVLPDTNNAYFLDGNAEVRIKATTLSGGSASVTMYLKAVTASSISLQLGGANILTAGADTTFNLTIQQDTVKSVSVTPADAVTLGAGSTKSLTAAVTYDENTSVTGNNATWTSSDEKVATVSNGTVTGVAPGTATITAAASGKTSNGVAVTVVPGVTIAGDRTAIDEGGAAAVLTATVNPADSGSDYSYAWTVPPSSPVTLTPAADGKTATVAAGTVSAATDVVVTCTAAKSGSSGSGTYTLTVYPKAAAVTIVDPDTNAAIAKPYTMTTNQKNLSYQTSPADAKGRGTVTWTSSDTTVATVISTVAGCTVTAAGKAGANAATITCSYKNPDTGGTTVKDSVVFNIATQTAAASDVTMPVTNNNNTSMSAAYTGIRNAYYNVYRAYPADLTATITFNSIPRTCGTLYKDSSSTLAANSVYTGTAYSFSSLSSMVYSPNTVGTEIMTYTLANGTNYLTGRIVVTVTAAGSTIVVNLDGSDPYTFSYATAKDGKSADAAIYSTIYSATGKPYSYLTFTDNVNSAAGTLYGSISGVAVTANTPYYYSSATNPVSRLYFVPASSGIYYRAFKAYDASSTVIFSGALQLVVPTRPAAADVSYSTPVSSALLMEEADFTSWYQSQTNSNYYLSAVTFDSAKYSNTSYPGYFQHNGKTFSIGNGVHYYTNAYSGTGNSAGNYLNKVTYQSPIVTGWVTVDFTCYGGSSKNSEYLTRTGTMYICITRNAVPDIRYTVTRGTNRDLAASDFNSVYQNAMNVSTVGSYYVNFINVPGMGTLTADYVSASRPGTTLTAANVGNYSFYVNYAGAVYSISDVSYVPGSYTNNTDTVKYAAYSVTGQLLYIGEIDFLYGSDSGTVCYSDGYVFSAADFFKSTDADPVYSVTFTQPATGVLYQNYACGSGTAAARTTKFYTRYSGYGSVPVSSVVYIPVKGYAGTVSIPYTATTAAGRTLTGTVVLTVRSKSASSVFYDVTPANTGSWSADSVDFANKWGLVSGTGASTFSPTTAMSRGMLVAVLYSAAGSPNTSGALPFTDVAYSDYYYDAVLWAYRSGIVSGKTATTFAPGANVTREQFAAILYAYAARAGHDMTAGGSLYGYSDVNSISAYARTAMQWAVYQGYISGTGYNKLNPQGSATRAQAVVILHSYLPK